MNNLERVLRGVRADGRKALVPFMTAGFPDRTSFTRLLEVCEASGCDAVEVGIPFSDPSADGSVIQRSSQLALATGTCVATVLEDVHRARAGGVALPIVLMTYYNPVLAYSPRSFAADARACGVDGVLLVDLPLEESAEFLPVAHAAGLDVVLLVAPTTPIPRLERICASASGFVYCVSVKGLTGDKKPAEQTVSRMVASVRGATDLPVLGGFGIDGPTAAAMVARYADGVIVGSAVVRLIEEEAGEVLSRGSAERFLRLLRRTLDESGQWTGA